MYLYISYYSLELFYISDVTFGLVLIDIDDFILLPMCSFDLDGTVVSTHYCLTSVYTYTVLNLSYCRYLKEIPFMNCFNLLL